MAGVLFYFPQAGVKSDPQAWFREAGLADLLSEEDDVPAYVDGIRTGPDGGQGRLAYWDDPAHPECSPRIGTPPERMVWTAAPPTEDREAGRFWFGYEIERPPTPKDLRRRRSPPGVPLALGRYTWEIPIARELPQTFGLDEAGKRIWRFERSRDQAYFDEARRLVEAMTSQASWRENGTCTWSVDEHLTFTLSALAVGYRVTPEILAAMNCIRNEGLYRVAWLAAGMPTQVFDETSRSVVTDAADAKKNEAITAAGGSV